jgi:hypothetical protein
MDAGTVTDPLMELSLRHAREQRQDMALWLAVEILMTDDMALADEELQNRLISLQDRIEDKARASARNARAPSKLPASNRTVAESCGQGLARRR